MASVDDLGTALLHIVGARQALARIVEADVDDLLTDIARLEDIRLKKQHARLCELSNWRRKAER